MYSFLHRFQKYNNYYCVTCKFSSIKCQSCLHIQFVSQFFNIQCFICFIDYSKAFDCINHELLWKTLLEMGIPKHLIQQLLKGLYENQSAVIRTEFGDTDRFKIKKGVR